MKLPLKPPPFEHLVETLAAKATGHADLLKLYSDKTPEKYLHWDQLRHRKVPTGIRREEWWFLIKLKRFVNSKNINLVDRQKKPFKYNLTESISEMLHRIDMETNRLLARKEDRNITPQTRDRYVIRSLINEAITSSQIEGATTTHEVAKEMIRTERRPRHKSEQMILNNYMAMRKIVELKDEPLTPELVFHIHDIVTRRTLDEPSASGRFRNEYEDIKVYDNERRTVLHDPPLFSELPARMKKMCDFANCKDNSGFTHPVLRSIILHFWLAYDHPFYDGNGRTARALFYWSMLHRGYWLFEFISISQFMLKTKSRYTRAYLYTENDENDLNYFIIYHLNVILKATDALYEYLDRKSKSYCQIWCLRDQAALQLFEFTSSFS